MPITSTTDQSAGSSGAQPMIRGNSNNRRAAAVATGRAGGGGGRFFIPDSTGSSPSVPANESHIQPSTYPARNTNARPGQAVTDVGGSNSRHGHTRRVSEHYHQHNPAPPFWRNIDSDFELDLGDYGTGEYSSASSSAMHSRSASDASSESSYGVGNQTVQGPPTQRALFPATGRSAGMASAARIQEGRHSRPADIAIPALQPAFDSDNPFLALAARDSAATRTGGVGAASPHTPIRYGQPSYSRSRTRGVYEPDTDTDVAPHSEASSPLSPFTIAHASRINRSRGLDALTQLDIPNQDMPNLGMPGLPPHMYEVLLDIHQTLYLGRTYAQCGRPSGGAGMGVVKRRRRMSRYGSWGRRVKEIKRVIEKSFEGDCVYDHPLVRLTNRDALLSHFFLLHFAASAYLPSVSPSALIHHAHSSLSFSYHLARGLLYGRSALPVIADDSDFPTANLEKGKGRAAISPLVGMNEKRARLFAEGNTQGQPGLLQAVSEWYDIPSAAPYYGSGNNGREQAKPAKGWWQLWEVNADCKEIGGMECYDGIHLAMIEQVITFTLLPSLLLSVHPTRSEPCLVQSLDMEALRDDTHGPTSPTARRASGTSGSDNLSLPLPINTHSSGNTGFVSKLLCAIAREFEYLLKWELPINTMVEFNEVGKATRIRDMVDIQDLVETFVPFAKRFSWLTRSVNGLVTSAVGSILLGATAAEAAAVKGKKGVLVPISVRHGDSITTCQSGRIVKYDEAYHYPDCLPLARLSADEALKHRGLVGWPKTQEAVYGR